MGSYTPFGNFYKPEETEDVNVEAHLNENLDKMDTMLQSMQDTYTAFTETIDSKISDLEDLVDTIANLGEWVEYTPQIGTIGSAAYAGPNLGGSRGVYAVYGELVVFTAEIVFTTPTTLHATNNIWVSAPVPNDTENYAILACNGYVARAFGTPSSTTSHVTINDSKFNLNLGAKDVQAVLLGGSYHGNPA